MFKYLSAKICGKVMILAVMLCSLAFISKSSVSANTLVCCATCQPTYSACLDYCAYSDQIKDWMRAECYTQCNLDYSECTSTCTICEPPY